MASSRHPIIIRFLIVLVSIGSLIGFSAVLLWIDQNLYQTRGYGLVSHAAAPGLRAAKTLALIVKAHKRSWDRSGCKWPSANAVAVNIPELVLVKEQAYSKLGIYVLRSEKTKQVFLYSPENNLLTAHKLAKIREKMWSTSGAEAFQVVACVVAAKQDSNGGYYAYEDYPSRLKKAVGVDSWKKWYFIADINGGLVYSAQSDNPPVPGCLAHIFLENPKLNKFFYPEEVMPILKTIYPKVVVPEEQILREVRDY